LAWLIPANEPLAHRPPGVDATGPMNLEPPRVIEIEPTATCNLRCRMCHVSFMPDESRPVLPTDTLARLGSLQGVHVILGSGFEPMMHRDFAGIVRQLTGLGASLELITNGTLLSPDNVSALIDADVRVFNFSFDGIRPATYERIRRRASHAETVAAIVSTRELFRGRDTRFAVNSTMMRSNIDEIPEIVAFWDRADFDLVRFLAMVVRENEPELIRESLFPIRYRYYALLEQAAAELIASRRRIAMSVPPHIRGGLVMSDNPNSRAVPRPRQEHQLGEWPGMAIDCRSPWTFARILNNGDVQLCYKFTIGNLRDSSFADIWQGERARAIRDLVMRESAHCATCDYYRFCLKSADVDSDSVASYFAGPLVGGIHSIDFAAGTMPPPAPRPPVLVDSRNGHNIVRLADRYLVVPQSLGPIDFQTTDPATVAGVTITDTLRAAQRHCG
jgi:radical SAM protein with 4Fe4S-binding SPASM domain